MAYFTAERCTFSGFQYVSTQPRSKVAVLRIIGRDDGINIPERMPDGFQILIKTSPDSSSLVSRGCAMPVLDFWQCGHVDTKFILWRTQAVTDAISHESRIYRHQRMPRSSGQIRPMFFFGCLF